MAAALRMAALRLLPPPVAQCKGIFAEVKTGQAPQLSGQTTARFKLAGIESTSRGWRICEKKQLALRGTVRSRTRRQVKMRAMADEVPLKMKGWKYDKYGSPDVLELTEVDVPQIADDQVLVKIGAAALNPVDFKRRQGKFEKTDSALPTVPGYDMAGVVVRVGSAVTKFKVHDEVFGDISEAALNHPKQSGTLAQYTAVEEKLIALKPKNLSFIDAAALPLALLTAYEAFERVNLKQGESVMIIAGAGGVGSLAIQLAKVVFKAGLVATTASSGKIDFVKSLGADKVVDYKSEDYTQLPDRYDVVFDTFGEGEKSIKVMKDGGRMVAITGNVVEPGFRFVLTSDGSKLQSLVPYIESGELKPVLDPKSPFEFTQLKEAFAYLETGRAMGKVVVGPINTD